MATRIVRRDEERDQGRTVGFALAVRGETPPAVDELGACRSVARVLHHRPDCRTSGEVPLDHPRADGSLHLPIARDSRIDQADSSGGREGGPLVDSVAVVPRFAELPIRPGAPPGSSWGVFGDDDEIGTLNFIRPDHVAAAAGLVRQGKLFSLNLGLELPDPPFFGRKPIRHHLFEKHGGTALDEYIDDVYTQASTQWDGLRHYSDPEYGFYNGARLAELTAAGSTRLGVQAWARRGIAARGLLLDVAATLAAESDPPDPFEFFPIGPELLQRTAGRQGVELEPGDVLLVRTGWLEAYEQLDRESRERLAAAGRPGAPGLHGDDVPAFLWDNRIAAVSADNPALEATRSGDTSPLSLHVALIARLGMPLGELWRLGALAADCTTDGVYETLLVSAPLGVPGGAGSPANALALK